jgi:hypothetical protein
MHVTRTEDESANSLTGSVLHGDIETFIANLKQSSSAITKGLGKSVTNDDLRSLLTVKEHLRNLTQGKENAENGIATNRSALHYLQERYADLPSTGKLMKDLETAASSWEATKALVPETLERIAAVDDIWKEKTRFKVEAYEQELKGKHDLFHKLPFWFYRRKGTTDKLGERAAKVAIMEAEAELEKEKRTLEENAHLCGIFELEGLIDVSRAHVNDMKQDLKMMSSLWVK